MNMLSKKYISVFATTVWFLTFGAIPVAHAFPKTTSSIMLDAKSGKILSQTNADEVRYPASLTKVMTLYITFTAIENGTLHFDDMLKVSRNAENRSPSKLGVRAGSYISVKDAVLALIVKSANDCATVLAENIGYSEPAFAELMTRVARELGMNDTTFKNASGLPNKQHKTTARDMAILAAAMYHHFPQYYHLFSTKTFSFDGRTYKTHNDLLKTFAGADGMKTGFTNAAGYNIITSAHKDNNRVIAVTMGHKSTKERDTKIANMMTGGLNRLTGTVGSEVMVAKNEVSAAKKTEKSAENLNFGIQIGAFSNYARARKYAVDINRKFAHMPEKSVEIEPVKSEYVVMYRSKIVGFAQEDAQKTCNDLKKANKSCIVVANAKQHMILAQR